MRGQIGISPSGLNPGALRSRVKVRERETPDEKEEKTSSRGVQKIYVRGRVYRSWAIVLEGREEGAGASRRLAGLSKKGVKIKRGVHLRSMLLCRGRKKGQICQKNPGGRVKKGRKLRRPNDGSINRRGGKNSNLEGEGTIVRKTIYRGGGEISIERGVPWRGGWAITLSGSIIEGHQDSEGADRPRGFRSEGE